MALQFSKRMRLALALAGLALTYLLFGWLALPGILQSQAEQFIVEKTGHHLSMARPEFDPLELRLRLSDLRLTQHGGEPLLGFRELLVDLSAANLLRGALVFDDIRLDGLEATLILLPNARLNWSALLEALRTKDEKPDSPLPRLDIHHFALAGARLEFADQRMVPAFTTRVEPMDLELAEISTLPNDKGQYKLSARTSFGTRVDWQGEVGLEPLSLTGSLKLEAVDLARLAAYFKDRLPLAPPQGIASLSTDYRFGYASGKVDLHLDHLTAKLAGLRLQGNRSAGPALAADTLVAQEGSYDSTKNHFALAALNVTGSRVDLGRTKDGGPGALELGQLRLEQAGIDLNARQARLGRLVLQDGRVRAARDAQGRIDLVEAFQSSAPAVPPKRKAKQVAAGRTASADWHYRLDKLELENFSAAFRDESVAPAADLALEHIALSLQDISDDLKTALPLRAAFRARDGGSFEAQGKLVPAGPSADFQVKLTDLSLKPAQPYLSAVARLTLATGQLSSEGQVSHDAKGTRYQGKFSLRDLRLNETESGNPFLSWKSLSSRAFEVTPTKLDIGELSLEGLDTQLIINKDKSLSIQRILPPAKAEAVSSVAGSPAPAASSKPFVLNIDRLRVSRSEMDFADYSLALPFGTRIHNLRGVVTGLSSQPNSPGQVELDGQVDDYGLARAVGQIDLFKPTDFMDLKVVFRNIEMTRLTPYSATFAGRKITSGKLSLDLEYKIKQRQLQGENKVIMDQLTLGERVDSPEAKNLPLDLAIAILQDADGRIDLGLPVSGSLDDPQFSYGGIVWKAIVNVITKIATAPFRALGALFGGGEKSESIAFDAGSARLTPPEQEKLVRLAAVLAKRPGLSLGVHGVYAQLDRVALQDRELRRSVAEKSGQQVERDKDPGPISTRQPKIQSALESLYADRFGSAALAALKEGFRHANPGQLEESATGKVMSRLSGLFSEKQSLNENEVGQLKGTDFYTVLFERLRNQVVVGDERLLTLARTRSEAIAAALKAAGLPAERMALLAAEKTEGEGREVPLKLVLNSAAK
ncbi:MAG: DUF748 domain-containing protein [Betaproteobacteria bacterium]|nr:DUF748 domain-containing protein [Betaproteobacteria bacterium]